MLSLIGKELYQWEIGRSVKFTPKEGESINEIHFANRGDALALVIEVTADDYTAEIPPELLQSGKDVLAWAVVAVDGDINTIARLQLSVRRRARPDNYVYTPTEILRWEALDERLKMVEGIDWNASEGEPGHILNRTHYVEGGKTELLPKTALTQEEGVFPINQPVSLVVGEHYTVNWNGFEYAATAYDMNIFDLPNGALALINDGVDLTTGKGVAFIIQVGAEPISIDIPAYGLAASFAGATALTLAIYAGGETVHKLDNKFLDLDWLPIHTESLLLEEQTIIAEPYDTGDKFAGGVTLESSVSNLYAGKKVAVYVNHTRYEATVTGDPLDAWQIVAGGAIIILMGKAMSAFFPASGTYLVSINELVPNKLPAEYLPDDLVSEEAVAEAVGAYMAENPIEETDPTVPAWAKAAEKPTYTAAEVGALPANTVIPSTLIVTTDDTGTTASHNATEIYNHVQAGGAVYLEFGDEMYSLVGSDTRAAMFSFAVDNFIFTININAEAAVTATQTELAKAEDIPTALIVTVTDGKASHTPAEIYAHAQTDGVVYLEYNNLRFWLRSYSETESNFITTAQGTSMKATVSEDGSVDLTVTRLATTDQIPTTLPNPNALNFTGAVSATYDGSGAVSVEIPDSYSKTEIDAIMGAYINDIDTLIGGDS